MNKQLPISHKLDRQLAECPTHRDRNIVTETPTPILPRSK